MKTKTVKRHWCDFCNKAGLQAYAMAKHEKHCTLNPARDCRVCGLLGGSVHVGAERMAQLVAMLPDPTEYLTAPWIDSGTVGPYSRLINQLGPAMVVLRKEVGDALPHLQDRLGLMLDAWGDAIDKLDAKKKAGES